MHTTTLPSPSHSKAFGSDEPPENRETSLSVRLEGGDAYGFPYCYLVSMILSRETNSLILNFGSHQVTVEGKNLHALYAALLMQSVQFIQVNRGHDVPEGESEIFGLRVKSTEEIGGSRA